MYIPSAFRVEDGSKLAAFIQEHSFATLISHDGSGSFASHLPILFRPGGGGALVSHMARANPQWQHFASGAEVLMIFQGPHGYVSPSWYQTEMAVPTWNYAAVHVYGIAKILSEPEQVLALLSEMVATFESTMAKPWSGSLPVDFRDQLVRGIVAFEISISRIEGKFKLGQNRSAGDIQGVYDALASSEDSGNRALAQLMLREGFVPTAR